MPTARECEGYARECVRLAGLVKDRQLRDQLFDQARDWLATAMAGKLSENPPGPPAGPPAC
jgi:hypothetical protein